MFDDVFGVAQAALDNDTHDPMDIAVPDPIVLELRIYESELEPLIDDLLEHHWIQEKNNDGWKINRTIIKKAVIAYLQNRFTTYTGIWSAADHMHGSHGTELQAEILDLADKRAN
jgi:hypothetical protein